MDDLTHLALLMGGLEIEIEPNEHNERYLKTKREKLNHVFEKL